MVKRICPKCNAEFDKKYSYDRHINKKFNCAKNDNVLKNDNTPNDLSEFEKEICDFSANLGIPNEILKSENSCDYMMPKDDVQQSSISNESNVNYSCSYCNKTYSSKYTLSRHLNGSCKIKKNNDNEKENIFKLLLEKDKFHKEEIKLHKEELNELKKQNKYLMEKIDKLICLKENSKSMRFTNNNTLINNGQIINNHNSIKQNNQIIMVNFGKEDLNIIDKQLFIDRIIKKNITGVQIPDEVLKIIHFNPMYPQLSNIYISDINRDKCMIFDDGGWKLSNIDNIPMIMDKICLFSKEQIEILKKKYPDNKPLQDRLKTIGKYNNMIDIDYLEELKDEIEENKDEIKRCEEFQKKTYNVFKTTMYNEGTKIKKNKSILL